jgi:chaperonin cofactor prefoldin
MQELEKVVKELKQTCEDIQVSMRLAEDNHNKIVLRLSESKIKLHNLISSLKEYDERAKT